MKRAAIIVPTYNEVENVKNLIPKLFEEAKNIPNWEIHVLVVDSNSDDGTEQAIVKLIRIYPKLHLLRMEKEGLGKAYIEGFKTALDKLNPYLLFEMDADLSHNPKDVSRFLRKIEEGADFVVGSRYIKGGSIPKDWGIHRKFFSVVGNLIIRLGFMRLKNTDWTNGFRAIKAWVVKAAFNHIKNYSGYVFQVAFLDFAIKNNAIVREIPVKFEDRTSGISKINALQYSTHSIFYVLTHSSFIKFVIVGLLGFTVDFSFAYFFINSIHLHKGISNMMSAEIAIMCNFLLNNFWSFRHKKIDGGIFAYLKKFFTFNLVSSGAIIIQGVGITITLKVFGDKIIHVAQFGLASWILYKILLIAFIVIPYSYILYNKFIWKEQK